MPDNKKKLALGDWSNIKPQGTLNQLDYSGGLSAAFGNTNFGESQYDKDELPSQYIKSGEFEQLRGERQTWGVYQIHLNILYLIAL